MKCIDNILFLIKTVIITISVLTQRANVAFLINVSTFLVYFASKEGFLPSCT